MHNACHTRMAPSPTGPIHLGTIRTAYFNWLAARATGGSFLLRIDDTDRERSKKEFVTQILETFAWLDLPFDALIFQSDRGDIYEKSIDILGENGHIKVADNGAYLLDNFEEAIPKSWTDTIGGEIVVSEREREIISQQFVLMKGDGSPSYNFCSVVDDIDTGVNRIIRGVDHISNTAKQLTLFNLLDAKAPCFTHVGLIHKGKAKLSKRDPECTIDYYKEQLKLQPAALLNALLRLGWAESDGKTIKKIDRDLAIQLFFEHGRMKAKSASLDEPYMLALNRKYK